ncbi:MULTISPECIES: ATP-binding cassette domain-containing protein [Streptomyces]|uniref:ATP-binding cassette domain-containing protein n=1 Tax=Streptomyces TaxID=1883 RepID=UPI00381ACFA6
MTNLTQRFGARLAVDRLSLSIPHGMFYGIVGPNGAGKTTALTAMCGLTGSRLGGAAVGGAIAAAAAGCAGTPLLAVVVPAGAFSPVVGTWRISRSCFRARKMLRSALSRPRATCRPTRTAPRSSKPSRSSAAPARSALSACPESVSPCPTCVARDRRT